MGGAETLKLSDFAYLSFPLINAMKQLGFQSLEYHEKLLNNKAVKYSTRKQEAVFGVGSVHTCEGLRFPMFVQLEFQISRLCFRCLVFVFLEINFSRNS